MALEKLFLYPFSVEKQEVFQNEGRNYSFEENRAVSFEKNHPPQTDFRMKIIRNPLVFRGCLFVFSQ